MKKTVSLLLATTVLLLTGCSSSRIISDSISSETVRTVTSEPIRVQIGSQYYSIYLSATDNGTKTVWNLLVDQRYKPVEDGLILLRLGNGDNLGVEEMKVSHVGYLGSDRDMFLPSDGKQTDRIVGWRATYPIDEKTFDILSRRNLTKIRIRSPRGFEESAVKPTDQTSNIGVYILNARKVIRKRLGVRHDRLIYEGF